MLHNGLFHWQEIQADHIGQGHTLGVQKGSMYRPFDNILYLCQLTQSQERIRTLSAMKEDDFRLRILKSRI